MFYAQWCQNCHALAPTWDAIATHLHAGSQSSKLIMALFDCEQSYRNMQLCTAAGVQHYPTLMFIGDGTYHDTDIISKTVMGKKSAGPAGPSPIPWTVKFQGQWQYADSVLDWIRTMQGISRWHKWTSEGFLRYIRNGLLGFLRPKRLTKKKLQSLPVGIPSTGNTDAQVSLLETKLEQTKEDGKLMEKAAAHAGLLLDAVLFPPKNDTDVFMKMNETGAWDTDKATPVTQVMRACTIELSLDYCSRLSTHVTNDYVDEMANMTEYPPMDEIEALLRDRIGQQEPYCALFDDCMVQDFSSKECRPAKCPFKDAGCRYTAACLDSTIEKEYAVALGLIQEGEELTAAPVKEEAPPAKKQKRWGI